MNPVKIVGHDFYSDQELIDDFFPNECLSNHVPRFTSSQPKNKMALHCHLYWHQSQA